MISLTCWRRQPLNVSTSRFGNSRPTDESARAYTSFLIEITQDPTHLLSEIDRTGVTISRPCLRRCKWLWLT